MQLRYLDGDVFKGIEGWEKYTSEAYATSPVRPDYHNNYLVARKWHGAEKRESKINFLSGRL